jgi:hypothetical protein
MTVSQKVQIDTFDFGASLTNPTLGALSTGTTITNGTANSCNEQSAESGVYIADFVGADASALIPAGTYRLRTTVNGLPLKRFVTFTGIDGELVYARSERAVELDSATRVKLDASQPDYAPLLASGYTAPANSDITAIKAKTDNLPSDPADQSLIIVATDAVMARLGTPAGASVSADLAAVKSETGTTLPAQIAALNNLSSAQVVSALGTGAWATAIPWNAAWDAEVQSEVQDAIEVNHLDHLLKVAVDTNFATTVHLDSVIGHMADNGTAATFVRTTDSLEAIRDNQSAGGGTAPSIVTLQSVAGISPGVILGPTEPLVIGDDYLTSLGRSIRINLLDANGDPAEVEFGSYALDDVGISIQLLLAKSGKPSTVADVVGTCTFFPAVGAVPPYLIVEFTRTETVKAIPGPYDMQAEAIWSDGKIVTFAPYGQIQFVRNIRRA